jgi:hypothetical protein
VIETEVASADQPHGVGVDDRVVRRDHLVVAEAGVLQALEELVPVGEIENVLLCVSERLELLLAALVH